MSTNKKRRSDQLTPDKTDREEPPQKRHKISSLSPISSALNMKDDVRNDVIDVTNDAKGVGNKEDNAANAKESDNVAIDSSASIEDDDHEQNDVAPDDIDNNDEDSDVDDDRIMINDEQIMTNDAAKETKADEKSPEKWTNIKEDESDEKDNVFTGNTDKLKEAIKITQKKDKERNETKRRTKIVDFFPAKNEKKKSKKSKKKKDKRTKKTKSNDENSNIKMNMDIDHTEEHDEHEMNDNHETKSDDTEKLRITKEQMKIPKKKKKKKKTKQQEQVPSHMDIDQKMSQNEMEQHKKGLKSTKRLKINKYLISTSNVNGVTVNNYEVSMKKLQPIIEDLKTISDQNNYSQIGAYNISYRDGKRSIIQTNKSGKAPTERLNNRSLETTSESSPLTDLSLTHIDTYLIEELYDNDWKIAYAQSTEITSTKNPSPKDKINIFTPRTSPAYNFNYCKQHKSGKLVLILLDKNTPIKIGINKMFQDIMVNNQKKFKIITLEGYDTNTRIAISISLKYDLETINFITLLVESNKKRKQSMNKLFSMNIAENKNISQNRNRF